MNNTQPVDQAYIKQHNIESLLLTLERCQPVSRTELARLTEMSSASVTRFVSALSGLGLVKEVSLTDSAGRGRKAVNLEIAPNGMYTLGCHFDTHGMRMCLLDLSNHIRSVSEILLAPEDYRPERLAQLAREQAACLVPEDPSALRGAGISVSGRIDQETGRVAASQAFGWRDVDLIAPFSDALGLPVMVENDVRTCLTWESMRLGLHHTGKDCAYLYLGRAGIGFACSVGGKLVRGINNSAGEIEEVCLGMDERLNEHLMEVSMVERARRFSSSVNSISDILEAHRMGLTWARLLMEDFVSHLNTVLQLVQAILDPHYLILGGDIPDALRDTPGLLPEGRFTFGDQFEDACACGAAVMAMQNALHERIRAAMEAEENGE